VACETDGVCTEQGDEERVFDPSEADETSYVCPSVRKESMQSLAEQTGTNRRKINGKFWRRIHTVERGELPIFCPGSREAAEVKLKIL
jgi:hypothetical protein